MSMFDNLDDLDYHYAIGDLLREVDDLIDEKNELEDRISDLEAQVHEIQMLRNGDVHLIEYIWKVVSDSGIESEDGINLIRQEVEKWWYGGKDYDG